MSLLLALNHARGVSRARRGASEPGAAQAASSSSSSVADAADSRNDEIHAGVRVMAHHDGSGAAPMNMDANANDVSPDIDRDLGLAPRSRRSLFGHSASVKLGIMNSQTLRLRQNSEFHT